MREILFRGKRADNEEWVYGWYAEYPFGRWPVKPAIVPSEDARDGHFEFIEVTPETVGQYTGLTDKNGKKIFEGDIVSSDLGRPYLIAEFRDGCFMFNCNDGENDYYDIMLPILQEPHTSYKYGEVIGNIYDQKGLISSE